MQLGDEQRLRVKRYTNYSGEVRIRPDRWRVRMLLRSPRRRRSPPRARQPLLPLGARPGTVPAHEVTAHCLDGSWYARPPRGSIVRYENSTTFIGAQRKGHGA